MKANRRLFHLSSVIALATVVFILAMDGVGLRGQNKKAFSIANVDGTHVGLGLSIRKLGVAATFMNTPSHPDDEQNAFFTYFGYGLGMRVIDVQNNRGEGGQNEIGPEIMHDIGMLRTEELMATHREDSGEQYFTRAIDYGYSYDPLGEIIPWIGEKEIVGDYVRLYRMLRPDVVVSMNISGQGGDRMHEAQTIMTREAVVAAGDPTKYPEQIAEGLRPWKPTKFYYNGTTIGGGRGYPEPPAAGPATEHLFDAKWFAHEGSDGKTRPVAPPIESGTYDRAPRTDLRRHRCRKRTAITSARARAERRRFRAWPAAVEVEGAAAVAVAAPAVRHRQAVREQRVPAGAAGGAPGRGAAPAGFPGGGRGGGYCLVDTTLPGQMTKTNETGLFDGIDITVNGLARFAGANPPAALVAGLKAVNDQADLAKKTFASGNDAATTAPIEAGLTAVRALRSQLGSMGLSDSARYEIDFRLKNEEQDFVNAVIQAHSLAFFAASTDGLVVAGQPINLNVAVTNRGETDAQITLVEIKGVDRPSACTPGSSEAGTGVFACAVTATISPTAKPTTPYWHDDYWSHPTKDNPARNTFDPGVEFGVPFAPTPFRAVFHVKAGSVEFTRDVPFTFHYVKDIYFGDKQMEINVIPALAAKVTPDIAVVPAGAESGHA